jgi:hypothetical protein
MEPLGAPQTAMGAHAWASTFGPWDPAGISQETVMPMMSKSLALAAAAAAAVAAAPAAAAPVLWSGNGHYYEFVTVDTDWHSALAAAAAAAPISGFDAHLVTLTSADEDAFVVALTGSAAYVWAAGSDVAAEGVWKWVAGPETGQIFHGPGAAPGAFSAWRSGEPNNTFGGIEHYLHINANGGGWNDIYATWPSGGYVVEYSAAMDAGVPEPATWAMMILGFGLSGAAMRRSGRSRQRLIPA